MLKPLLALCLALLCPVAPDSSPWEPLSLPTAAAGKTLRGVEFVDARSGWIVGDLGLCLQTQDGGKTWTPKELGTKANLRSVRFFDPKTGIITGDGDPDAPKPTGHIVMGRPMHSGIALWTLDGGATWKKSDVPTNFEITCALAGKGPVQLGVSGSEMHLDGDIVRSPTDLTAWDGKNLKTARCYRALFDLRAVDAKRWIAVGSPVSVGFVPPPTDPLYTRGACRVLVSDDGGETWAPSEGSDGKSPLRSLVAGARAVAVGDAGAVLVSDDRGSRWSAGTSGTDRDLYSIARATADPKIVVAAGDQETTVFSQDAGRTWKQVSRSTSGSLLSVAAAGDDFIVVGENGTARRATVKALADAKAVASPAKAPGAAKGPTKAQLERVRVGDRSVYDIEFAAPALKLQGRYEKEERISVVGPDSFTLQVEIVKGNPPPGSPRKGSQELRFADIDDFSTWAVGQSKEDSDKTAKIRRTRVADEKVTVGDRTLDCMVIEAKMEAVGGGITATTKNWFAKSTEIPSLGLVKEETLQEMAGPQGKIRITQTTTLIRFERGKP